MLCLLLVTFWAEMCSLRNLAQNAQWAIYFFPDKALIRGPEREKLLTILIFLVSTLKLCIARITKVWKGSWEEGYL